METRSIVFLCFAVFMAGRISTFFISTNHTEQVKSIKEVAQPKPQPKDTTTYHFSDEFTDAQLREMVRSGHLKLR